MTDDDSTLRAHCRNIVNEGKLPDHIPQPIFLADLIHRIKVMVKHTFQLVTNIKYPDRCKTIDPMHLKKCISCYIEQHHREDLVGFSKAP